MFFEGLSSLIQVVATLFFGQALFFGVNGGPSLVQQGIDFVLGLMPNFQL